MNITTPITANAPLSLLGGMSAEQFLSEYWHKKPLLIRAAIPNFNGLLSPNEMAGLACEDDVQSRLVIQKGKHWSLEQGPFAEERFASLPEHGWTLLMQSLNHHLHSADELMQRFNFLPYSRLDDLMVSYAPDGGGVGPHFDSYDVFLLQGLGQRLWRISEQTDLSLVVDAPLKILQHFDTSEEWVLNPGDMLYLPPHLAHWGIAIGECMTYSIGFRAPSQQEIITSFFAYLQEQDWGDERYQDPDLKFTDQPAKISADMTQKISQMLQTVQFTPELIQSFLATYLSEPKAHVLIQRPRKISLQQFTQRAIKSGVRLGLQSQLLYTDLAFYLNGEILQVSNQANSLLRQLANQRSLSAPSLKQGDIDDLLLVLHKMYLDGCLQFN